MTLQCLISTALNLEERKKKISATGKIYDKNILYRDTFISMPLIDVK